MTRKPGYRAVIACTRCAAGWWRARYSDAAYLDLAASTAAARSPPRVHFPNIVEIKMAQRPSVKFLSKKLSLLLALLLLATGVMACAEEAEGEANQEQNQNQNQGIEEGIEVA